MRRAIAVLGVSLTVHLLFTGAMMSLPRVRAQSPNRAGLVVAHSDGTVRTHCVEFSEPEITGDELLTRAGLSIVVDPYPGTGVAVCAIAGEGCPASDCFCQCKGSPCIYWAYYRMVDNQWVYSGMGASTSPARDGDVQGWAWGEGGTGGGAVPPLKPFDEICIPPSPTPSNTPLPTETSTPLPPTATRTATPVTPTATRRPPTDTPVPADTATPKPSETRAPSATPPATATATGIPQLAPSFTLSPTDDPGAGQPVSRTDTAVPADSGTSTPVPSTTPLSDTSSMTPVEPVSPTPSPYSSFAINTRTPMPTAISKQAIARAAMATKAPITAARAATSPPLTAATATPSTMSAPVLPEDPQRGTGSSYLLFGVLTGGLAIFLIILRVRRSP